MEKTHTWHIVTGWRTIWVGSGVRRDWERAMERIWERQEERKRRERESERTGLGGERKAKVSMERRHAPVPLPGPSLPFVWLHPAIAVSNIYHTRLYHGSSRRRSCEAPLGPSEAHVALPHPSAPRRSSHRVACLAVGSCLITASHSMQYNYNKTCSTHFYQYQTQTYTRPLLISVLLQLRHVSNQNQNTSERLLCMECPRSSDVCVRFVRS